MGGCGGATESGIGGRMCDCVLGLHVTGVAVYRETTGKTMALGPAWPYGQCSSTTGHFISQVDQRKDRYAKL